MADEQPSQQLPYGVPLAAEESSNLALSSAETSSEQGIHDLPAEQTDASTNLHQRCSSDTESVYSLSLEDAGLNLDFMEAPYQWGQQEEEDDVMAPYYEDLNDCIGREESTAAAPTDAKTSGIGMIAATPSAPTSGSFVAPKILSDMFRPVGAPHSSPAKEVSPSRPARHILLTKESVTRYIVDPLKAGARNLNKHISSTPSSEPYTDATMKSERVVDMDDVVHLDLTTSLSNDETVPLEGWKPDGKPRKTKVPAARHRTGKCCLATTVAILSLVVIGSVILLLAPSPPIPGLDNLGKTPMNSIPTTSPDGLPVASPISMPAVLPAVLPSVVHAPAYAPVAILPPTELVELVSVDADEFETPESPYYQALQFVGKESYESEDIIQRFGVALLDAAVGGTFRTGSDECVWYGVTCNENQTVTAIRWADFMLPGSMPQDIGLLSNLQVLDLGQNQLLGSIPNSLYDVVSLEELYLHSNQLTGTLSEGVGALKSLRRLLLGENQLRGSLPQFLGSPGVGSANVRPLEFISLYKNKFTGHLPTNWNLRELFYLDVGENNLSGSLPLDWFEGRNAFSRLRVLYLNDNQFSGSVPTTLGHIGNGRLTMLSIQNNTFTGEFPGFPLYDNLLNVLEIQDNQFSSMNKNDICNQIVFNYGELVMLRADCDVCKCKYFCREGECYNAGEQKKR